MSGEPDDGEGRPKILNKATGWVGGLTALVVALAGLRAAYNDLRPPAAAQATGAQSNDADAGSSTNSAETNASDTTATDAALPTSYTGEGVTMEWIDRQWVVTDKDGTYKYDQQGDRSDGMTYARTSDGKYALRWKNDGGDVELSDDADHTFWRHYYSVSASSPDSQ